MNLNWCIFCIFFSYLQSLISSNYITDEISKLTTELDGQITQVTMMIGSLDSRYGIAVQQFNGIFDRHADSLHNTMENRLNNHEKYVKDQIRSVGRHSPAGKCLHGHLIKDIPIERSDCRARWRQTKRTYRADTISMKRTDESVFQSLKRLDSNTKHNVQMCIQNNPRIVDSRDRKECYKKFSDTNDILNYQKGVAVVNSIDSLQNGMITSTSRSTISIQQFSLLDAKQMMALETVASNCLAIIRRSFTSFLIF